MDSTALLTVVAVAVAVLFVFLIGLCLNCKGNSQPTYIRQQVYDQRNSCASGRGNQGFTLVRPYIEQHPFPVTPVQPSQHQLIPSPSMGDARQPSPCPSSDGGSQSDYINQNVDNDAESYEQPPEKTPDYPDYLDVLPDDQNVSQHNLASSLNSGQSYQNIENDNDDDSDSQHYINVSEDRGPAPETPVGSFQSCSSDGQGSSDYVNAPTNMNYHLG